MISDIANNSDFALSDYLFPLSYRYSQKEISNNEKKYQEIIRRFDQGDIEFSKLWLL